MRIAFFGGSFDPPHLGHLHIARTALNRLRLDRVLLAPVGRQPLKSHHPAPFADRLAMLQLLVASQPGLTASPIDAPIDDAPNYTAATLARLRPTLPPAAELFFLAGADSFLTLPQWHHPEALLQPPNQPANHTPDHPDHPGGLLTAWILAARPGFPLSALASALPPGYTLGPISENPGPVLTQSLFAPDRTPATPLHLLADLDDPSTATRIRDAFAHHAEPPHLSPAVGRYIRANGLYNPSGPVLR